MRSLFGLRGSGSLRERATGPHPFGGRVPQNPLHFAGKWGGLSTKDCGKMACALLNDSYTTTEQMFGIIFAIHKKVGTLYGIDNIQKEQAKYHMSGYPTPFPMFLYKLCRINGDTEETAKKTIAAVVKLCQK